MYVEVESLLMKQFVTISDWKPGCFCSIHWCRRSQLSPNDHLLESSCKALDVTTCAVRDLLSHDMACVALYYKPLDPGDAKCSAQLSSFSCSWIYEYRCFTTWWVGSETWKWHTWRVVVELLDWQLETQADWMSKNGRFSAAFGNSDEHVGVNGLTCTMSSTLNQTLQKAIFPWTY